MLDDEMGDPMELWLAEYTKESTRRVQKFRFERFLEWTGKTPQELVDGFTQQRTRSLILRFQNYLINDLKLARNSSASHIGAVRAFYASRCSPIAGLKGKIQFSKMPIKREHRFSLDDLRKMWHIANTRDKAILTVGCSLGWEVSAIRDMKREFYESLVKRARSENLDFIEFWTEREKEEVPRLGILNPCAIDALERWLEKTKDCNSKWLWINENTDERMHYHGFNRLLVRLAGEANLVLTGKLRWHLLRKWLMSALSSAGLGEWEVKIIVGKSIPSSDSTYLEGLRHNVIEKYKKAYPEHLSLVAYTNHKTKLENIEDFQKTLAQALYLLYREIQSQAKAKEKPRPEGVYTRVMPVTSFGEKEILPKEVIEEIRKKLKKA